MYLLLLITLSLTAASTQLISESHYTLKIGDTLDIYLKYHPIKFTKPYGDISDWYEGKNIEVGFLQESHEPLKPIFLISGDKVVFGVFQGDSSSAFFLFDTDGNGILDFKTKQIILPFPVVFFNSKNTDNSSNEAKEILDFFYSQLNLNAGFDIDAEETKKKFGVVNKYKNNINLPNRDLIYLLNYGLGSKKQIPDQSLLAMQFMETRYKKRYGEIHPIILLFALEACKDMGDVQGAKYYSDRLYSMVPQFIPAKFYHYKYEDNPEVAKKLKRELLQEHPNHWLIKEKID